MALDIETTFRDHVIKGDIHSGSHEPDKAEIRSLLKTLSGSASNPSIVKQTKSALDAVAPSNENYGGLVLNDPTSSNNGYYFRSGGVWVKSRGLPDTIAKVSLSGTATEQTGSSSAGVNPADVLVYFATVGTENTGPMTLSIGGGVARDVVNAAGNPLSAGEWTGTVLFFLNANNDYQLLFDAGAVAAAAASASSAASDADRAEAAADAALGAVPNVFSATKSTMSILDKTTITETFLKASGFEKQWFWSDADLSAEVAADHLHLQYQPPDASTGLSTDGSDGAWVRVTTPGDRTVDGREYLWPYWNKVLTRSDCTVVLSGDSTTQGVGISAAPYLPQNLLYSLSLDAGVKNQSIINEGHASQHTGTWDSTYVLSDMSQNPDLYVVRWGINDVSSGRTAANFETSLRSGLAKVRAHTNGGIDDCTVILMVPNTISEDTYGRNEVWVETIRPIIRKAARDFHCVYFDTYELLKDGETGTGRWLDNPSSLGGIHPTDTMNAMIFGALAEVLWPRGVALGRVNGFTNISGAVTTIAASVAPSNFPFGTSLYRTDAGYPFDGIILTTKHVDGPSIQFGFDYQSNPNGWVRIANSTGNSWSGWSLMTSISANLSASSGFALGSGNEVARACREGNTVIGAGWLTKGTPSTIAAGTGLATFPVSFRPRGEVLTSVVVADGGGNYEIVPAQVSANGSLVCRKTSTVTAAVVGLSMIAFDVASS